MNHNIANTAVHYNNRDFLALDKISQVQATYDQDELTTQDLSENTIMDTRLGYGAFGVTFTCQYNDIDYVIKLPVELTSDAFTYGKNAFKDFSLDQVKKHHMDNIPAKLAEAIQEMKEECIHQGDY